MMLSGNFPNAQYLRPTWNIWSAWAGIFSCLPVLSSSVLRAQDKLQTCHNTKTIRARTRKEVYTHRFERFKPMQGDPDISIVYTVYIYKCLKVSEMWDWICVLVGTPFGKKNVSFKSREIIFRVRWCRWRAAERSRIVKHLPQLQIKSQILSVWIPMHWGWHLEQGKRLESTAPICRFVAICWLALICCIIH